MNGNAFALQRRTDLDGGLDMTGQQIMYAVGGETRCSGAASNASTSGRVRKCTSVRVKRLLGMARTRWIWAAWSGTSNAAYRKKEWMAVSRRFRLRALSPRYFSKWSRNATINGALM